MNKKLLAAAIAAAMVAAPAAFAESTVYGKLHTSIDSNDFDNGRDNWEVRSRSSRLGFKGSEDLGGGLKAIYQIELSISSDGGAQQNVSDGIGSQRNTFIGLSGGFGTFLVGRHDTPMKIAFYGAGNERLGDSIIDLNSGVMGVFQEVRANNAIAYVSPSFSGFTFAAAVVPGEEFDNDDASASDANGDNASDGIADHVSLGLIYKGNGLKASIGYEELDNQAGGLSTFPASGDNEDMETFQVGMSYTMNNLSAGIQYQDTDNFGFAEDVDYEAWAITGKATFGNNAISLVYTMSETDAPGSSSDVDTDGWGVAAEHNFSKRTKVYAAYGTNETDVDGSSDEDDDVFSLGMIHNF